MRIGRSLTRGDIFVEVDGKLSKMAVKKFQLLYKRPSKRGFHVVDGFLIQWGEVSNEMGLSTVIFDIAFNETPNINLSYRQGERPGTIMAANHLGFSVRTYGQVLKWMATSTIRLD